MGKPRISYHGHTYVRNDEPIKGGVDDALCENARAEKSKGNAKRLLEFLNGDIRQPLLVHHCVDCGECPNGLEDSKLNVYASLLSREALLARRSRMPSQKY